MEKTSVKQPSKFKSWLKSFFFSFIWLGILMLVLDLISKQCIVAFKENIGNGVAIIPNFITVQYVVNTNFIFGIPLSNPLTNRIIYIIVGTLLAGGLITYYCFKHKKMSKYVKAVLMLIIAGALGNLIDRIFYNKDFLQYIGKDGQLVENGVVDWIRFEFNWFPYTFNWADSCIVVGAFMLVIWLIVTSIIDYRKEQKKAPKVVTGKQLSTDEIKKLEKEKNDASLNNNSEDKKDK